MKTCCQTSKNEISNVKNVYQVGYVGNADPVVGDRSEVVAYQIRTVRVSLYLLASYLVLY